MFGWFKKTKKESVQIGSALSKGLDANALNDAGWAFIDAWGRHTDQKMSGDTWNHIKPMVAAAILEYLNKVKH